MTDKALVKKFDDLQRKRQNLLDAHEENKFGIEELLGNLYPDQAHFIYELLQNADDADAKSVCFDLQPHQLRVTHDGTRLFTIEDVDAITNMAGSTKKEDNSTAIGKFGVGFKAVFHYTKTPHIYSGELRFKIFKMFVPERVDPVRRDDDTKQTAFVFPFDRDEKPQEDAVGEIAKALGELGPESILFLPNILRISYQVPGQPLVEINRRIDSDERVTVQMTGDTTVEGSRWMVLNSLTDLTGGRGEPIRVAAAFKLTGSETPDSADAKPTDGDPHRGKGGRPREKIVPVEKGSVCVYFPAVRETSGLRFHIHAPFASSVARDSISDAVDNDTLIEKIGALIASALPKLVEGGLLNDGLLEALPNGDDELGRYAPIRDKVVEAFNNQSITPRRGGGYAPANFLYRGVPEIPKALEAADLRFLVNPEGSWAAAQEPDSDGFVRTPKSRWAKRFVEQLNCREANWEDLNGWICDWRDEVDFEERTRYDTGYSEEFDAWMKHFDDEGLIDFYALLGRLAEEMNNLELGSLPIICVATGSGRQFVRPKNAYIPERQQKDEKGFVPGAIYLPAKPDATKEERLVRDFFAAAGVQVWDSRTKFRRDIEAWKASHSPRSEAPDSFIDDEVEFIKQCLDHFKSNPEDKESLVNAAIFQAVHESGERTWEKARDLYFDKPYEETGFHSIANKINRPLPALAAGLEGVEGINEFVHQLGGNGRIRVVEADIDGNRDFSYDRTDGHRQTDTGINWDWWIKYLPNILKLGDDTLRAAVWKEIVPGTDKWAEAVFRKNSHANISRLDSQLVQTLRDTPWIPDLDGALRTPRETEEAGLPPNFPYRDCEMLRKIDFGQAAKSRHLEEFLRELKAKSAGFRDDEELERALEFSELPLERQKIILYEEKERESRTISDLGDVLNPEQRRQKAKEKDAENPDKQYEKRQRSTRVSGSNSAERKAYLRLHYEQDGAMACQCCEESMPFKLPDGLNYFEAVACFPSHTRESHQNALALCPVCAAKFLHANDTPEEQRKVAVKQADIAEPIITGTLAGKECRIRFAGRHLLDLQGILEN